MLVSVLRVTLDLSFEISHRVKRAATNRLAGNLTEPDLDLIEPRRVGGRVVNMKASSTRKPSLNSGMLVSSVVVHDQMHIELFGHASLDMAQEGQEFLMAMARFALVNTCPLGIRPASGVLTYEVDYGASRTAGSTTTTF